MSCKHDITQTFRVYRACAQVKHSYGWSTLDNQVHVLLHQNVSVLCKTSWVWLKVLYIQFYLSRFLLILMEPQNKICTAYSPGSIGEQQFSKKKKMFLRGQRSKLDKTCFLFTTLKWSHTKFFMLQDSVFNFKKRSKNGDVMGNWIVAGIAKNEKWWMALTRKSYSVWGSNCAWVHVTTSTSYKPSLVQFWEGHVKT